MAEESRISDDLGFLQTAEASLRVKEQKDLVLWLQNDVQRFIPHDVFIVAWGDFPAGKLSFDVIPITVRQTRANPYFFGSEFASAKLPCTEGRVLPKGKFCGMVPFLVNLRKQWHAAGCAPFALVRDSDPAAAPVDFVCSSCDVEATTQLKTMNATLVHGLSDHRGKGECLYVFLSKTNLAEASYYRNLRFLLPYVDFSLRQVAHKSMSEVTASIAPTHDEHDAGDSATLSQREIEIMDWVRVGKTNYEVGIILNISAFTVKNHLQRIFKKLDATNRAQAVERMARLKRTA